MTPPHAAPLRLLVVLPSWVGDAVMATPTLRALRDAFPGIFIGGLCRPGIDDLLAGTDFFDELHVERAVGVMGPKFVAAKVRPRRYDTALLLTNSFSTALIARIAGIPRRIGYDRDARGLLLTDKAKPPLRDPARAPIVPTIRYYWLLAERFLLPASRIGGAALGFMELDLTPAQAQHAIDVLARAGLDPDRPRVVLNPGGNNPAKRWPADRFAAVGAHLARRGFALAINGSPQESALAAAIAAAVRRDAPGAAVADLAAAGVTLGALKGIIRGSRLLITNDTGPRHVAAAFGTPVVTLFGPTDHRITDIPTRPEAPEIILPADPTLPDTLLANDHPDRCAIDRISTDRVTAAADRLLQGVPTP